MTRSRRVLPMGTRRVAPLGWDGSKDYQSHAASSTGMCVLIHLPRAMRHGTEDGIEDVVEMLADILCQEPQDEVPVLLQQRVFAPVTAVGMRVIQMYRNASVALRARSAPCAPGWSVRVA